MKTILDPSRGENKILILDFEDSFTFNIAESFLNLGLSSPVSTVGDFPLNLKKFIDSGKKFVLVLGPGPGHPKDYDQLIPLIKTALDSFSIFNLGVCLGHQIYLRQFGHSIRKSEKPIHGQAREIVIPDWLKSDKGEKFSVQFYNSLIVEENSNVISKELDTYAIEGEILIAKGERFLSYQFHPESIGTSCPDVFLTPARDFLYNNSDE